MSTLGLAITLALLAAGPLRGAEPALRGIRPAPVDLARTALVIGNGSYRNNPLRNPVNDAHAMAAALRECGFDVLELSDCGRNEMRRAIRDFEERISRGGIGLFYYAGHGIQVEDQNYLVPVDVDIISEYEVADECLQVSRVLKSMQYAQNRMNIVILDACRNNPFKARFRAATRGLARLDAPPGTLIAYATAPGSVAVDGRGSNGIYTAGLLKYLHQPGIEIEEVFKRVRRDVMQATGNLQVPWEASSLVSDFCFFPHGRPAPPARPLQATAAQSRPPKAAQIPMVDRRWYIDPASPRHDSFIEACNRFAHASSHLIHDALLDKDWLLVDSGLIFSHEQARRYCAGIGGKYRLPTLAELASLITRRPDTQAGGGRVAGAFFPDNTRSNRYWTGSPGRWGSTYYVDLKQGTFAAMSRDNYCALILISD